MSRFEILFGALVVAQAAHSIEEYLGRLWESFPPAQFLTLLISQNQRLGFLVINIALVAFGVWCFFWPVRRGWSSATYFAWGWVVIETLNGIGHPFWSIRENAYTPGVATAPFLLVIALLLGRVLVKT